MRNPTLILLAMGFFAGSALGEVATFRFEGTVTQVGDPQGHLAGSILPGATFDGQYTLDSSMPDKDPSNTVGDYDTPPPFLLNIGTLPLVSMSPGYWVINNGFRDSMAVGTRGFTSEGFDIVELFFVLTDNTGTILPNTTPILDPPPLDLFSSTWFMVQGRPTGTSAPLFTVQGTISSIAVVPEPGSLVLAAVGGLLFLRRRRRAIIALGLVPLFLFALTAELSAGPTTGPHRRR